MLRSEDFLAGSVLADTDSIGIRLETHYLFEWQPEVDPVFSTSEIDSLFGHQDVSVIDVRTCRGLSSVHTLSAKL